MRVITGEAKGKRLKSPKTAETRPIMDRVKTALFDILSSEVADARFLDLFAGTGGVGIEALSRGATRATFIEMSPVIVKLVRENLQITGMTSRAETLQADFLNFYWRININQFYQLRHVPMRNVILSPRRCWEHRGSTILFMLLLPNMKRWEHVP